MKRALFSQAHDSIMQVFKALNERGAALEREWLSSLL